MTEQQSTYRLFSSFPIPPHFLGIALCAFALVLSILPFFVVRIVPAADLPQHLAQIRLFYDILSSAGMGEYSISIFSANVLVYWVLAFLWLILSPLSSAKVLMVLLVVTWICAVFLLAWHTKRSFPAALLAATMVFNASFYWGFVNFLIGFPLFILWYLLVVNAVGKEKDWRESARICLVSILLFLAHVLWLGAALSILILIDVRRRAPLRSLLLQGIGIFPVAIIASLWFPSLAASRASLRFDIAPHWIVSPLERLQPAWIVNSLYGGLHSVVEWLLVFILLLWGIASVYSHRTQLRKVIEWDLLFVSFFFFCIVYLAPEKYLNTIYFASRWYPIAATFFLLALPSPRFSLLSQILLTSFAFVLLAVITTLSWRTFERYENNGLLESLESIPPHARVLGLDFVKESQIICGRPFMQNFAYAQALRGSEINFSFALHHSGIVRTSEASLKHPWTPGLEWFAELVRFEDFRYFDYALVNAHDDLHAVLSFLPPLAPVTQSGRWRLYRCTKDTTLEGSVFKKFQ